MKTRLNSIVYSLRMKIRQKSIVYSVGMKIRPQSTVYSLWVTIRQKSIVYRLRVKYTREGWINKFKYLKRIFWTADERSNRRKILAVTTQLKQLRKESLKKKKTKKIRGEGIRTQNLCDAGAVLYQLSYQASWHLKLLLLRNIPVKDE